jgi:beta-carotene hydroxylase
MRLRFVEDTRTLIWALLLFPLGPALAGWRPALLPWLAPLLLYCSYLAGVLTHHHNHAPVFHGRAANVVYAAWLSVFYGFPIVSWWPTHNQNHHRYRDGVGDLTSTRSLAPVDGLVAALLYPLRSSLSQLPALVSFVQSAFRTRSRHRVRIVSEVGALVVMHALAFAAFVARHGLELGGFTYVCALGLPALLGSYWMMLTNYLQHVGCEPDSEHDHSRNFVSPLFNWFVFESGLHTVHHEQPGVHWSRYRALHAWRAAQIRPDLDQPGSLVGFFVLRYLLKAPPERAPASAKMS